MKLNLKWSVVIIAFIITFSIIYAANYWSQQRLVMEPLMEELLSLDGVEDVQIANVNDKEIYISLSQVSRLAETYRDIEDILKSRNESESHVIVVDKRSEYLEGIYEKIHFALMEGERKGNYTEMKKGINFFLKDERGLDSYSLTVDQKRIYLQLDAGNYFLYEIIPLKYGGWEAAYD